MTNLICQYPKLSDGFYKNALFRDEHGNKKWVVGDLNSGSQFMLKDGQMTSFETILQHLNGENSVEAIALKSGKSQQEVISTLQYMEKKGLIEGVEGTKETRFNEVDQFSIPIVTYNFSSIRDERLRKFSRMTMRTVDVFIVISLLLFLWNATVLQQYEMSFSELLSYGNGKDSKVLGYILINCGMIFSFFLHELGHLLTGIKNGIDPEKFQFSLFLGFIPLFYIKNKNIYSLSSRKILDVLLAGVKINLFLFLLMMNLYAFYHMELFKVAALSNARIIIINLFPLTLSDGYFVLTILTGRSNLRQKYHLFLGSPKQWKSFILVEKVYILLALMTFVLTLLFEFQWIMSFFPSLDQRIRIAIMVFFLGAYLYFMHCRNVRRFSETVGGR